MTAQNLSVFALWSATVFYALSMVLYSVRMSRVAEAKGAALVKAEQALEESNRTGTLAEQRAVSLDDDETPVYVPKNARKIAGAARSTAFMGALLHGVGVVARGIEAGHAPWTTMYEYAVTGSFIAMVVFLIVQARKDAAYLGSGVTALATITLGICMSVLYRESTGLQPALQSFWLVIHVSIATIATGILAVAAIASLLQLGRDYRDNGEHGFDHHRWRFLDATPSPERLEALAFRLNAVGFVLWVFTVIAGAIWAEYSWGRYWGWDPKEVWSFVVAIFYAAYLHARTTQGWTGRKAAYLALAGFVCVIMNFTVVNMFPGLHSYAKP